MVGHYRVAYPLAADNVLGLLPCRLRGVNQPVIRTRNRFSRPRPALLACLWTHMGRSTPRFSPPAATLDGLWLRPRRHAIEQHLFQRSHVIGQSRRHRWRTRPPHLRRAAAIGRFRNQQGLAQTGVGQYKVMVHLEQCQLMPQAVSALAQCVDPTSYRRYALADIQVEPLHKGRIDRLAAGGRVPASCG